MDTLDKRMQDMIAMQPQLQQMYYDQQKVKRIAYNKSIAEKKYYGNSKEYWQTWKYMKSKE